MEALRIAVLTLSVIAAFGMASAHELRTLEVDQSGHGAILCTREFYLNARAINELCFSGQDTEFLQLLDRALDDMDVFVASNGPAELSSLRAERAADIAKLQAEFRKSGARTGATTDRALCESPFGVNLTRFYTLLRDADRAEWARSLAASLAVPRKPLMNPCL